MRREEESERKKQTRAEPCGAFGERKTGIVCLFLRFSLEDTYLYFSQ